MISGDDIPDWARALATFVLGAGGLKVFQVWLEDRRLGKKEYRDTLLSMIRDLQTQVANLREEVGHLEEALHGERATVDRLDQENARLRARLEDVDDHPTTHLD